MENKCTAQLQPFTPNPLFTVHADWELSGSMLNIRYRVEGPIDKLRALTEPEEQRKVDLWKSTCFEAFLKLPSSETYFEWNFAANRSWGFFAFESYRKNWIEVQKRGTGYVRSCAKSFNELVLEATADLSFSPALLWHVHASQPLELGLTVVLEDSSGAITYWALAHKGTKPDFHLAESFIRRLDSR